MSDKFGRCGIKFCIYTKFYVIADRIVALFSQCRIHVQIDYLIIVNSLDEGEKNTVNNIRTVISASEKKKGA